MKKYVDDKFDHLESDIDKIRLRHRQYISYSNEGGARSVVDEILNNALDECRTSRSPGDKIDIHFDERTGFITVRDNGRGIPTSILEQVFTSLNMGSNIYTSNKADLKVETLGQNGTGTLAICGLAEEVTIESYRGGTENVCRTLVFREGIKIKDETTKCSTSVHGMCIRYKPSKVMGKNTRIVWSQIHDELLNLQYLNRNKIKISSIYIDNKGNETYETYNRLPLEDILYRNGKDNIISNRHLVTIESDDIIEELDGESVKRFISMDVIFVYTSSVNPYIDSFSNSNNTVDNGDHLEGAIESLCRFLQITTKGYLSEKEKEKLDIKWDDVKTGLSVVVSLRTNYERLYTGQTKHKVVSPEIRKIITQLLSVELVEYFRNNQGQLKELVSIVKMNAKARREGDKVRNAVVKSTLSTWSSYKIKNYDPCTRKGIKEYKELFIIEGESAKGSLKQARDPRFQALFAIRGVSANVFKLELDQVVGQNGNKEFTDLIKVMNCNVGNKFDLGKLQFNKIIIASDADVDGLFIRSLLMAFFFKLFPEIILDGRLYIAEPPLYRVNDKMNPFVVNKEDYINRYVNNAIKDYKLGYCSDKDKYNISWLDQEDWKLFLSDTSSYVDIIEGLIEHYKTNGRLLEIIFEEFAFMHLEKYRSLQDAVESLDIQHLMDRIGIYFPELYYDDKRKLILGPIDAKQQLIEIDAVLVRKGLKVIDMIRKWHPGERNNICLMTVKNSTIQQLSLLEILKILKKYQPTISHRFKGLGENDDEDIKTTIMDPNTRTLIKVSIGDIQNDMNVFQVLRGSSKYDAQRRKILINSFEVTPDIIDT